MELIFVLVFLLFLLAVITVAGHVIWVVIAAALRWLFSEDKEPPPARQTRIFDAPDDLTAFERQLVRFYKDRKITDEIYELLITRIRTERAPKTTDNRDKTDSAEKVVVEKVVVQSVSSVVVEPKVEPPPKPVEPPPPPPPPPPPAETGGATEQARVWVAGV